MERKNPRDRAASAGFFGFCFLHTQRPDGCVRVRKIERSAMKREKSEALVERDKQVISPCSHLSYFPLVVAKGKGAVITDVDGNEFIDFLSSASCSP